MVLGIDASRFSSEASTGVEFYSRNIIMWILRLLKKQRRAARAIDVVLYTPRKLEAHFPAAEFYKLKERIIPCPKLWTQIRLSYEMIVNPPDVLFVPSHVIPLYHPKKTITMIHDVAFRYTREAYSPFQYYYLNFAAWFACKFAYKILTPTNAVKQDLVRFYNCNPNKIFVVPHGLDDPIESQNTVREDEKEILRRFGVRDGQSYILFVGRLEEKKNLVRLVRAFGDFLKKYPDWKMILAGKRGIGFEKIWRVVEENNLWNKVLIPGYIDDAEKRALFKNCRIFAFPSLQEGFGFPILEAFHYKKPLLTSDIQAVREVAGDAAFYIDPQKEKDIVGGLMKLAKSKKLCGELVAAGAERIKNFKWESAARKTLKILLN